VLRRLVLAIALLAGGLWLAVFLVYGGGERLDDRTGTPELAGDALEVVADLELPPGNVAVSADGRVFFTFHPEGAPATKLAEWVDGRALPYPSPEWQTETEGIPYFRTPLAVRIDRQDRLWVLDFARYALATPRLLAFALENGELVYEHAFPREIAPLGSMLNDFQVDAAGGRIFIAEASPFLATPAIVVHDVAARTSRRLLERHPSVLAEDYVIQAPGRDMVILGAYTLRIGVDSIALDRAGEWLYYGPVNGGRLYRARVEDLIDESLAAEALAARVETFSAKTLSDGLSTDDAGNVYLTDMEHSAILRVTADRELRTVIADRRLRWPDGLSFGPDGSLYVTASALQEVIFRSGANLRANAPYSIFRFRPGPTAAPGH
jgi:sugar lactone lactonase YvrE